MQGPRPGSNPQPSCREVAPCHSGPHISATPKFSIDFYTSGKCCQIHINWEHVHARVKELLQYTACVEPSGEIENKNAY